MSFEQLGTRVITSFKADVSDHKAALKSLRGEERKRHQELLAEVEGQNAKIDGQIAMWGKIAVGIGIAVGAYKLAQGAANAYLEDVRLKAAAAGANVDGLRKATMGLIETDQLLEFAGKAQAGVWRLNQSEMETVLRGASALRKTMGVELQPTIEKLTEAMAKGSTRALKEFGIEAKDKEGVLRQLSAAWQQVGGDASLAGDDFRRSGVQLADEVDDLKGALGEFVVAMHPVIGVLADAVRLINHAVEGWKILFRGGDTRTLGTFADQQERERIVNDAMTDIGGKQIGNDIYLAFVEGKLWLQDHPDVVKALQKSLKKPAAGGRGGGPRLETTRGYGGNVFAGGAEGSFGGGPSSAIDMLAAQGGLLQQQEGAKAALREQRAGEESYLASLFGPIEEFDKYATAFGMLSEATTAAFDAWIIGSESLGIAFAKSIAESLRSLAKEFEMQALRHAAFAIGDLAFGNIPGAIAHGKAAAAFAAGAVVVGATAKTLGSSTGQWSQGGAHGGGGGAPSVIGPRSSGGGGGTDGHPVIVYVGAEWAGLSPIEQSGAIVRAIELGKRGSNHIRRS